VDSFSQRGKLMKPEHAKYIKTLEQCQKALYRIYMGVEKTKNNDVLYQGYVYEIDELIQSRRQDRKQSEEQKRQEKEER
jgi:hypothetical protein